MPLREMDTRPGLTEVREFEDQFVNVYGNRFLFLCPPNEPPCSTLEFGASGGEVRNSQVLALHHPAHVPWFEVQSPQSGNRVVHW